MESTSFWRKRSQYPSSSVASWSAATWSAALALRRVRCFFPFCCCCPTAADSVAEAADTARTATVAIRANLIAPMFCWLCLEIGKLSVHYSRWMQIGIPSNPMEYFLSRPDPFQENQIMCE